MVTVAAIPSEWECVEDSLARLGSSGLGRSPWRLETKRSEQDVRSCRHLFLWTNILEVGMAMGTGMGK
jgi:hypothetical protein